LIQIEWAPVARKLANNSTIIAQEPINAELTNHPEQAASDCWLELNAAVTLNLKYKYSEKRFNKQGSRGFYCSCLK